VSATMQLHRPLRQTSVYTSKIYQHIKSCWPVLPQLLS